MSIRSLFIGIAGLGLAAAAGAAGAQPSDSYDSYQPSVGEVVVAAPPAAPGAVIRSERISFADLDLDAPQGAHTLLMRISGAAKNVCSPEPSTTRDLRDGADYSACVHRAIADAVDEVDAPSVDVAYRYGE